jgi:hypothetical protein
MQTSDDACRVYFAFAPVRPKISMPLKQSSDIHALMMTCSWHRNNLPSRLPSIRDTWCSAQACPITIPQRPFPGCFPLLPPGNALCASCILLAGRECGRGVAKPFPDSTAFFYAPFAGFGTDPLRGVLLQLLSNLLEVCGRRLPRLADVVLRVGTQRRATSRTRVVL